MDMKRAAAGLRQALYQKTLQVACHGNGFIQAQTSSGDRFHFFGDRRIPRQRVYTGIHDHRFGFDSTVLFGRLLNVSYDLVSHHMAVEEHPFYVPHTYTADPTALADTKLYVHPRFFRPMRLVRLKTELVNAGETYTMAPYVLHETFVAEPTITHMRKTSSDRDYMPVILVPEGKEPDNSFDRGAVDPAFLRMIVIDMLNEACPETV